MLRTNWTLDIDAITEKFRDFQALSEAEFNYKTIKERWSVAQNIGHLILLNNSYFEQFEEIQNGRHELYTDEGLEELAASSLLSLQPYTSTDRSKRADTWDIWQPKASYLKSALLQEFISSQQIFKHHIIAFEKIPTDQTFVKYPGHSNLIFKLDDCINFLIDHEKRHWNQASEII